ncbi:TetR/AcrR family transcriptional regulator [Paraconexibacter sp.]|uniref:TetR/AcrR family transcriptional regulator n=1 Tax=Paraconexibacter sp. TaxID=2949640 RepID=UPI003564DE3D
MASTTGTRDRILFASAELMRRGGYAGTGLKQVVTASGAPFGSLYHFFPGGKEQLAEEVLRGGGSFFLALFEHIADEADGDVVAMVESFFAGAAETVRVTDYQDACPIATVALEVASTNETLRSTCAEVFTSWLDAATRRFEEAGIPKDRARLLSLTMLSALEGAFVLARTLRDTSALDAAGAAMAHATRRALADRG